MIFPLLITLISLTSCSFFTKQEPSNEVVDISDHVIKADRGIEIEIKPIDLPYALKK